MAAIHNKGNQPLTPPTRSIDDTKSDGQEAISEGGEITPYEHAAAAKGAAAKLGRLVAKNDIPTITTDIKLSSALLNTMRDKLRAAGVKGNVNLWKGSSSSVGGIIFVKASVSNGGQVYEAKGGGLNGTRAASSAVDNLLKQVSSATPKPPSTGGARPVLETDVRLSAPLRNTLLDLIRSKGVNSPVRAWISETRGSAGIIFGRASVTLPDGRVVEVKNGGLNPAQAVERSVRSLLGRLQE